MNCRPRCSAAILTFAIAFGSLILAGCGSQQSVKPTPPPPSPSARVEAQLRDGNFLSAAQEYSRLAQTSNSDKAKRFQALAIFCYLDGGDREAALTTFEASPSEDSDPLTVLAMVVLGIGTADGKNAVERLKAIDTRRLTPYQRSVYDRAQARASIGSASYASAFSSYVAADRYILPSTKRAQLHTDIWRTLAAMDGNSITAARSAAIKDEVPWLDLALAVRPNMHEPAALAGAISRWQSNNQNHAANISLAEYLLELSEDLSAKTRHIALLLPFHGRYENAADAIRDGFLSAWYGAQSDKSRPSVSIYSVDATTVNAVYDRAVENGADVIVGPLEKTTVETLTSRPELRVRTLTLNVADNLAASSIDDAESPNSALLFQFGLAPEDEAREAADRMRADGHVRAVVIGPESQWGRRIIGRFNERWQTQGGILLDQVTYGTGENTYSNSVQGALNVDLSEARAADLRRLLRREIEFEPRRRADVDAIFLAGFPLGVRQLLPQLRYFRAEEVPMYSTSHAYSGLSNPAADQDLDGLNFGDMPWLFGAADAPSLDLFTSNWPDRPPGSGRLFALGLDAYRILPYLARMRHQPDLRVPGTTGLLSMDENGRVVRRLTWARFSAGAPRLIDR
jgi:outer membrane PBP1 activator LpoA protein